MAHIWEPKLAEPWVSYRVRCEVMARNQMVSEHDCNLIPQAAEPVDVPPKMWLKPGTIDFPFMQIRRIARCYLDLRGSVSIAFLLVLTILGCAAPPEPPILMPFNDGRELIVVRDFEYQVMDTQERIIIPSGFVTDLASTPRYLWSFYPPFGTYQRAAIVHDYLYWIQVCTREQADNIFRLAMYESEVNKRDIGIIYLAVRRLGAKAWKNNAQERGKDLPRFVPQDRIPFLYPQDIAIDDDPLAITPLDKWPTYRARLKEFGPIPEPGVVMTSKFCAAYENFEGDI